MSQNVMDMDGRGRVNVIDAMGDIDTALSLMERLNTDPWVAQSGAQPLLGEVVVDFRKAWALLRANQIQLQADILTMEEDYIAGGRQIEAMLESLRSAGVHASAVVEGKPLGVGCWCNPVVVGDVIVHRGGR